MRVVGEGNIIFLRVVSEQMLVARERVAGEIFSENALADFLETDKVQG